MIRHVLQFKPVRIVLADIDRLGGQCTFETLESIRDGASVIAVSYASSVDKALPVVLNTILKTRTHKSFGQIKKLVIDSFDLILMTYRTDSGQYEVDIIYDKDMEQLKKKLLNLHF